MATFGIRKFTLYANDPEVLCAFYARLGAMSFTRIEGSLRYEAVSHEGVIFAVEKAIVPLPQGRKEYVLTLRVDDVEAALARLGDDEQSRAPIYDQPLGRTATLRDPEGLDIDLWAPWPERVTPSVTPPPLVEKPALIEAQEQDAQDAPPAQAPAEETAAVEPPEPEKPKTLPPPPLVASAAVEPPPFLAVPPPSVRTNADGTTPEDLAQPALLGAPGPIISAVRPAKVPTYGGGRLSLFGANFTDPCKVLVDGEVCPSVKLVDSFTLEVTTPAHAQGRADLAVENADGQRAVTHVLYDEGPVIDQFSPLEGSPRGGTEILIEGRNFQDGCVVTFFGNRAPEVSFEHDRRIRFMTPPQEGSFHGELRVTNPDGLSVTAAYLFTYRLATPRIDAVTPPSGLIHGGKRIAVTGEDFHPKCAARIGGKPATVTFRGPNALDLVTPHADAVGAVDLCIENPDGQIATATAAFTYEPPPTPPKLVEVRPDRGFCAGGGVLRLIGDNFEEDTVVRIGEVRAVSRLKSRNEIEVETPARAEPGLVAIELVDRDGVVVRREEVFRYESRPAPRIDSVAPKFGYMVGGARVVLEGEHFGDGVHVRVGGQAPKKMVIRSGTVIELIAPPSRSSGFVDIEIGHPGAGTTIAKNAFHYEPSPSPIMESVAPTKGRVEGGSEVTITGKNFVAESTVTFGGKPAPSVKFVDATTLDVKTPPGKNGDMVDVSVKNPDGKTTTTKRAFMYDGRYR